MLHIKLPKGKTAAACHAAGNYHARLAEAERTGYLRDLEAWRKGLNRISEGRYPPYAPKSCERELATATRLLDMADTCSFSTGDVYVSAELWHQIKGYYE